MDEIRAAYEAAVGEWTGADWGIEVAIRSDSDNPDEDAGSIHSSEDSGVATDAAEKWRAIAELDLSADAFAGNRADIREAIAKVLELRLPSRDENLTSDRCEAIAVAWKEMAEELEAVEDSASEAEEAAEAALAAAEEGNLDEALEHAERACRIEGAYGDCPTWRSLYSAIEAEIARLEELETKYEEDESDRLAKDVFG